MNNRCTVHAARQTWNDGLEPGSVRRRPQLAAKAVLISLRALAELVGLHERRLHIRLKRDLSSAQRARRVIPQPLIDAAGAVQPQKMPLA